MSLNAVGALRAKLSLGVWAGRDLFSEAFGYHFSRAAGDILMMRYVAGSTPRIPGAAISPKVSEFQAYGTGLVFVKGLPLVHGGCVFK